MKKICLILICMVISAFSLSSCGNSDNEAQSVANVVSTVTISCAGDCTLASDESFLTIHLRMYLKITRMIILIFLKTLDIFLKMTILPLSILKVHCPIMGRDRIRNMRSEENPIM